MLMLEGEGRHDLHELLKACYFADKEHLNEWGRPIFVATYRAMKFGPVPLEIYEMLKGEPIWLAELGVPSFPWRLDGFRVEKCTNETADMRALSESNVKALRRAHTFSSQMSFGFRTAITHGRDWQAANLGTMKYEDMIDEGPNKAEKVAYLREAAPPL